MKKIEYKVIKMDPAEIQSYLFDMGSEGWDNYLIIPLAKPDKLQIDGARGIKLLYECYFKREIYNSE